MKTEYTNLLFLTLSAFWSSLGGRYKQVSLYHIIMCHTASRVTAPVTGGFPSTHWSVNKLHFKCFSFPKAAVDIKSPLAQVMAWCRSGDTPLPETMMVGRQLDPFRNPFSDIWKEIRIIPFKKIHLEKPSAERRPFWLGINSWWRHQMETFSALLAICAGNLPVPTKTSDADLWCFLWSAFEYTVK